MKYFLGLDNGGTTTKAALYDSLGNELGVASMDTKVLTPYPDFAERDMEEMWRTNCSVIKNVIEKTKVDVDQIAGVAVCGHGKGLYLWGKDNKPVRNGIISSDNRAWRYVQEWEKNGVQKNVFLKTFQNILPCQAVSILAWMKDHEAEKTKNIQWIFECKDYIRFRLTGKAMAEITDYSGANLVNLKTKKYDCELMELLGLEDLFEALPPLCASYEICGSITREAANLTGLKEGTPVAGGMFDVNACAIAVNVIDENKLCMIAGTWSINEYIRKEPVLDGKVMLNSIFCIPEYYLIEESSATSAGNYEWFISNLLPELKKQSKERGESVYEILNEMVANVDPNQFCPIFTPFLMGTNVHLNAKASFVGINSFHKREHLIRAIFEGIVFSHKTHFNKLMSTRDKKFDCIRLAGGAAKSDVWSQMFADIIETTVEVVDVGETGTLGCAITAAVAVGEYKDFTDASKNMTRVGKRFIPNETLFRSYRKKFQIYENINNALDAVWDGIQSFMDCEGEDEGI